MPPKRGRPPGSKNKKPRMNIFIKHEVILKEEDGKESLADDDTIQHSVRATRRNDSLKRHYAAYNQARTNIDLMPKKPLYSCTQCNKKFRFKKSFSEHLKKEHSDLQDSFACDNCSVRCPDKETLAKHIKKVHERDTYACPHCKKEYVRRSHVLRHMAQRGCDGNEVVEYPCEICHAVFTRKDNLMVHLRQKHINKGGFSCKICGYDTKSFFKLVNHWMRCHSDTPNYFECDHCGKSTSSRAAISKHLEIHGEKKYSCDVCGYATFTVEVMRRHVLTHVEDKPYKCRLCAESFIQRVQLQRHLEKHTGNICITCGLSFNSKAKLAVHERDHMGLTKLLCSVKNCIYSKKEFSSEASLQNHIKSHLEEKPEFSCEICSKTFHSEVNMRRHMLTHTLDRPRRCMYCVAARAYVRGEQLVRHVRKHHPHVFREHLTHVRQVLGASLGVDRVKKSELESILNVLDAESDRILQGYSGSGILYGGMQIEDPKSTTEQPPVMVNENPPLMSEEELTDNLRKLLSQLIDKDTLAIFGWPEESVDVVLEKVIDHCGAKPADREKWTYVQRLRENAKHLFLYVIEDKTIARMLDTHTIDQIIKHILKVSEDCK